MPCDATHSVISDESGGKMSGGSCPPTEHEHELCGEDDRTQVKTGEKLTWTKSSCPEYGALPRREMTERTRR